MAIMRVRQPQVLVVEAAGAHGMRSASVDDSGRAGGSQPIGVPAGAADTDSKPDLRFVLVTLALVLTIWGLAFWWNPLKLVLAAPATLAAGVSVFALLYIAAQAVERLLEPLSSLDPATPKAEVARDQSVASALASPTTPLLNAAAAAQAALEKLRQNKAVLFWGLATLAGMVMSALTGIYLLDIVIETPQPPPPLDILVTGLVVGGGTKPLHDLITRIEKAKDNAQDPAETRP